MTVRNADIAVKFARLADLLEIEGANPFRVRAYRQAALTIDDLPHSLADMVARGEDLSKLPGIGADLAEKIKEIVTTGRLALLEEVEQRTPPTLVELLDVPGLGPKRVKALHERLKIDSMDQLEAAVRSGQIRALPGFGEKTETSIRLHLEHRWKHKQRIRLKDAEEVAERLLEHLRGAPGLGHLVVAGSYRRRKETVGDLDILATAAASEAVIDRFVAFGEVAEVLSKGPTRSAIRLTSGLQIDLRVVAEASYGAALHYFTGSKAHNIRVRSMAQAKGLKVSEYGVFRGERQIAGRTEEEVYAQVDLPFIEPELREDRGEIEAALAGRLPKLITLEDIRGDLHVHSRASDGRFPIRDMAEAARARGYEYLAITDHSRRLTVARGLDPDRLARQIDEIDRLNDELDGITILKSSEVDILEDGSLDLPDSILERLDLRVCSIHYKFDLPREKQTDRVIRAMDNPNFNILAHPTGRLLEKRAAYEIDLERVMAAALERGCYLELNAQPDRLDLDDAHCKMAKEMGLDVVISTDAHGIGDLALMRFGIGQARRGWLEPQNVLNTQPLAELRRRLKR